MQRPEQSRDDPSLDSLAKRNPLNEVYYACGVGLINHQPEARQRALEMHTRLWEIWALLRSAVGLRSLLRGLPPQVYRDTKYCEAWLLACPDEAIRANPHVAALHQLSDKITMAQMEASMILRS